MHLRWPPQRSAMQPCHAWIPTIHTLQALHTTGRTIKTTAGIFHTVCFKFDVPVVHHKALSLQPFLSRFSLQYTSSMRAKYLANSRPDPNNPPARWTPPVSTEHLWSFSSIQSLLIWSPFFFISTKCFSHLSWSGTRGHESEAQTLLIQLPHSFV